METKRCMSGYPCSIYEVRKISSMEELWYYAKVFVNTAHERGMDPDIIITMLYATLNELTTESSVTCPNFNDYGKSSVDICEYIITNGDVPPYKGCTFLYKRIDSKLTACRLCEYHDSLYRNKNEVLERSIVKFMLKSEENLSLVSGYIESDFFESCIDVSLGIPVLRAYAVPMMRILVNSILKPNVRTFLFSNLDSSFFSLDNTSTFDTVWEDAYSDFPRKRKLPVVLTNNPVWKDVIKKHVRECIDSAPDITRDDFLKVANLYLKRKEIDEKNILSTAKTEDNNYIQMQVEDVQIENVSENLTSVIPSEDLSVDESSSENIDSSNKIGEVVVDKTIVEESFAETNTVYDEQNFTKESVSERVSEPTNNISVNGMRTFDSSVLIARNIILNLTLPDKCICVKPLLIKEGDSVSKEYKKGTIIYLDKNTSLPGAFYHGVLRDKQLPIEVVKREDGSFLYIMYSRHMNLFFAAAPFEIPLHVKELLSRAMIQKICHTPYLLYSVSKAYSILIKNVFSIQTAHGRLVPGKELLPYKNLIAAYPTSRKYGYNVSQELYDNCIFLGGMPTYRSICKVLTDMLNRSDVMVEYFNDTLFDEALGFSYLYSLNFEDSGSLMILVENGKFLFKEEFNRAKKNNGVYLSYLVRNMKNYNEIFRFILQNLAQKGIFRKCNLQVIGMHNGTLNLYVSDTEEEYISTLIDLLIFEYGRTYSENGVTVESMRFI